MVAAGPTGVSSILLAAPGFDDDFSLWAGPIFAMLETCVGAIQAEEMIGVVCFHPKCKSLLAGGSVILQFRLSLSRPTPFLLTPSITLRRYPGWKELAWIRSHALRSAT